VTGWEIAKTTHVSTVVISISLFVLRGMWMMAGSRMLQQRWVRIVPHVNDTLLLASAIALALITYQYPLRHDWLTAKVIGLVLYIGLGMVALRRGPARGVGAVAWLLALVVFAYIVAVAFSRNPWPFGI